MPSLFSVIDAFYPNEANSSKDKDGSLVTSEVTESQKICSSTPKGK